MRIRAGCHRREFGPASVFCCGVAVWCTAKSTGGEAGRPWHPILFSNRTPRRGDAALATGVKGVPPRPGLGMIALFREIGRRRF